MHKDKLHIWAAAITLALLAASCDVPGALAPADGGRVLALRPVAGPAAKAAIDGNVFPDTLEMKVSARHHAASGAESNYFSNTTFSRRGTETVWRGGYRVSATSFDANPKFWPSAGTLDLFAYSAHGLAAASRSYAPSYGADVSAGVTIDVEDNSAVQSDILWGRAANQTFVAAGNPMVMRHCEALAVFVASADAAYDAASNTGVTITSISLDALYSGTLAVDALATPGQNCTWTALGSRTAKALPTNGDPLVRLPYHVPATARVMDVTPSADARYHMGIGGVGILVPEQAQGPFHVEYVLHNGLDDEGAPLDYVLGFDYVPEAGSTWDEGRKYVYTITFTMDAITVTPTVADWTAVPVPVPVP